MKKKLFIWMAAACTALIAAMVSCETPDVGENEDDGNNGDEPANVDVSMTGIWTIDPDAISGLSGLYIHQFRINEDGTGEVLYVDLNDTEFLYDYTVKLTVKEDDNSIEFTIDDVTPETKVSVKYQLDEQNRLNLAFGDAGTAYTYIKAEEWGDFGLTTVFTGSWVSDDSYDKMYLNVEKYGFLERGSHGVYVDKDNNEYPCKVEQIHDAMKYYMLSLFNLIEGPESGEEMAVPLNMNGWNYYYSYFTDPVRDGDKLKVNMAGIQRTLKPMKEWPFSNYDDIYTPPGPGEKV
ncbi:MAG: hypothetical protein PUI22_01885 [Bacteroidales bacterium]|nr:hypothetical protein [Bacteroidales bacterium]MDY5263138.1 hypothetical protein [Candidatus Cryptobacteroides sp.]MDY5570529.1 hypothetical protein [Candidatus Cryptobacteroides sp.]